MASPLPSPSRGGAASGPGSSSSGSLPPSFVNPIRVGSQEIWKRRASIQRRRSELLDTIIVDEARAAKEEAAKKAAAAAAAAAAATAVRRSPLRASSRAIAAVLDSRRRVVDKRAGSPASPTSPTGTGSPASPSSPPNAGTTPDRATSPVMARLLKRSSTLPSFAGRSQDDSDVKRMAATATAAFAGVTALATPIKPSDPAAQDASPAPPSAATDAIVQQDSVTEPPKTAPGRSRRKSKSKAGEQPVQHSTFPDWLLQRQEFEAMRTAPLNTVVGLRKQAEDYLKFKCGVDTTGSEKYFTGPKRTLSVRRGAILDPSRSHGPDTDASPGGSASSPRQRSRRDLSSFWRSRSSADLRSSGEGEDGSDNELKPEAQSSTRRAAKPVVGDADFAQAERLLQRAFVTRVRAFGMDHESTLEARTNLLKCYIAQNKLDDVRSLRDHPRSHVIQVEDTLAKADVEDRKVYLKDKLRGYARQVGAASIHKSKSEQSNLELHNEARLVQDRSDLALPPRLHGVYEADSNREYAALKGSPARDTVTTMIFPQHQAGAQLRRKKVDAAKPFVHGNDRSSPELIARPLSAPSFRPHAIGAAAPPSLTQQPRPTASDFRDDAKEQLELANYERAADSCRAGLALDGGDSALRAMFHASLGRLSEYPRKEDFAAAVTLSVPERAVIGEPLNVRYTYEHKLTPDRPHTSLDWIGLFKVLDNTTSTSSTEIALMDVRQRSREVLLQLMSGKNTAMEQLDLKGQLQLLERKREQLLAQRKLETGAEQPLDGVIDKSLSFGDIVLPRHQEVLVGWMLVPPGNSGVVSFHGLPTEIGDFRVRYFVHGSQCNIGNVAHLQAVLVQVDLDVPETMYLGDKLVVKYAMHYEHGSHGQSDWAGLYVRRPQWADEAAEVMWSPYDHTHPIAVVVLPRENSGTFEFDTHPVYPGIYQVRLFVHQDVDSCVAVSIDIHARVPASQHHVMLPFLRELRLYIGGSFTGGKDERDTVVRLALPQLKALCEDRCVAPVIVDLRHAVETNPSGPSDSGVLVAPFLQELRDCRPFAAIVLGQGYCWLPAHVPASTAVSFPWTAHHHNAALPSISMPSRAKASLFAALKSASNANDQHLKGSAVQRLMKHTADEATVDTPYQPAPVGSSIMELEIMASMIIPMYNESREDASYACVYQRHPSLNTAYLARPPSFSDPQPTMRVTEAALLQLKAQMHQQHVNVRAGYSTPNELVEWVVQNVTAALEEEFPRRRLPSPHMLWTINSQAYAAIRKQFVVTWPYYIAAVQRVVSYATSSAAPARPFCVVGPHGTGKSHLIALAMALLYDQTRPVTGEHSGLARLLGRVRAATAIQGKHRRSSIKDVSMNSLRKLKDGVAIPGINNEKADVPGCVLHGNGAGVGDGVEYLGEWAQKTPNSKTGNRTAIATDLLNADRDADYQDLPTAPAYFSATVNGNHFAIVTVHIGGNGGVTAAPEIMRMISSALAPICRCEPQAANVAKCVSLAKGVAAVKSAFLDCLAVAGVACRVVIILDGLDALNDCQAVQEEGGPAPLWWLPNELPANVALILTLSTGGKAWATCQARGWSRDRVELKAGPPEVYKAMLDRALSQANQLLEWSANHGLHFRFCLNHPVSRTTVEALLHEDPSLVRSVDDAAASHMTALTAAKRAEILQTWPGQSLEMVLASWIKVHPHAHSPLYLKYMIADWMLCDSVESAIISARDVVTNCATSADVLRKILHNPKVPAVAMDVLCLLRMAQFGLQESELIELMGGARSAPHERRQSVDVPNVFEAPASTAADEIKMLKAGFFEKHRTTGSLLLGPVIAYDELQWSQARRWLLSTCISRGRGLWNLDGPTIAQVVDQELLTEPSLHVMWLQHLIGYFWVQPAGRRKAEMLPALLLRLYSASVAKEAGGDAHAVAAAAAVVADAEAAPDSKDRGKSAVAAAGSGGAAAAASGSAGPAAPGSAAGGPPASVNLASTTAVAGPGPLSPGPSRRGRRRRSSGSETMGPSAHYTRPSTLFACGLASWQIFPAESKKLLDRIAQCVTNVDLVTELDSSEGDLKDLMFACLRLSGRSPSAVAGMLRRSFEETHGIQGYARAPLYQHARNALIDPEYEKHKEEDRAAQAAERETKMGKRSVWVPTRKRDTSNFRPVNATQWERLRRLGSRHLTQMASVCLQIGASHSAYSFVDASILLNLGYRTWEELTVELVKSGAATKPKEVIAFGSAPKPAEEPAPLVSQLSPGNRRDMPLALQVLCQLLLNRLQTAISGGASSAAGAAAAAAAAAAATAEEVPTLPEPSSTTNTTFTGRKTKPSSTNVHLANMTVTAVWQRFRSVMMLVQITEQLWAPGSLSLQACKQLHETAQQLAEHNGIVPSTSASKALLKSAVRKAIIVGRL